MLYPVLSTYYYYYYYYYSECAAAVSVYLYLHECIYVLMSCVFSGVTDTAAECRPVSACD